MISLIWNDTKTIVTLILNDVKQSNAIHIDFIQSLSVCLDQLEGVSTLKICVIKSAGKHFCVGADIAWLQSSLNLSYEDNIKEATLLAQLFHKLYHFPILTIALAHGSTLGGGLGLLACCDFILASNQSSFCFSEIKLGMMPATIAPYVAQKMPLQIMRRLMFTAEVFNAHQAQSWGFVDEISETDDLDICCEQWCHRLSVFSKRAFQEGKVMFSELSDIHDNTCNLSVERLARMRQSADGQEGLRAFLEKREPKWCDDV